MSENETKRSPRQASASTDAKVKQDVTVNKELQSAFDEANDKGYFGTVPDETPNEDYTVEGVTKSAKTQKG